MALKKFARGDVILPAVVFLLTFVVALFSLRLLSLDQEKDERLRAVYAAESTISRVSSQLNRYLAKIMNGFPQYSVCMQETHHVHKLDAPSGTAITLAEEIIDNIDRKKDWKRGVTYWTEDGHHDEGDANITDEDLVINCVRDGEVPGIHAVMYDSDADMITIEHSAHSRKGFALGAVLAAEFTANHSGLLTTSDLFKF